MRDLERYARHGVVAAGIGCVLVLALNGYPLVLPIVVGSVVGLLVRLLFAK